MAYLSTPSSSHCLTRNCYFFLPHRLLAFLNSFLFTRNFFWQMGNRLPVAVLPPLLPIIVDHFLLVPSVKTAAVKAAPIPNLSLLSSSVYSLPPAFLGRCPLSLSVRNSAYGGRSWCSPPLPEVVQGLGPLFSFPRQCAYGRSRRGHSSPVVSLLS